MYFKLEPKSKTEKVQPAIYLLVSGGLADYMAPETDTAAFGAAAGFLSGFVAGTANYRLSLDIEELEKVVQNAEKLGLQDAIKRL